MTKVIELKNLLNSIPGCEISEEETDIIVSSPSGSVTGNILEIASTKINVTDYGFKIAGSIGVGVTRLTPIGQ